MTFNEFLESCRQYKEFVIVEEKGNKKEIERVSKQHGKKTKGYVLLYNKETEFLSRHQIYVSTRGYSILWCRRKILLEKFKWQMWKEIKKALKECEENIIIGQL